MDFVANFAGILLGGLSAGTVLFIVSVGLSVTMGLMGFVNLAHGAFAMFGGYDGMAAIVHAVQATKGKMDGDDAVKSLLGWKFDSPQGPIMIDPETRDIIMNEYLSEVVKGPDGKLHEKQLAVVDSVKDQCKVLALGPCAPKK